MNSFGLLVSQARYSIIASLRSRHTLSMGAIVPIVMFLGMCVVFGGMEWAGEPAAVRGAGQVDDLKTFYVGAFMAYAVMYGAFGSFVVGLTNLRQNGVLKRLRGTPLPLWTFVLAQFLVVFLVAALAVIGLWLIAGLLYGIDIEAAALVGVAGYLVVGTLSFVCITFAATCIVGSVTGAQGLSHLAALALAMTSGVFFRIDLLPDIVRSVAEVFPLEPLVNGFQSLYATGTTGVGLDVGNLIVLGSWGFGSLLVALRFFRWDPQ